MIVPEEAAALEAYGVAKIYSPEDGAALGLQGIANHMLRQMDFPLLQDGPPDVEGLTPADKAGVARLLTALECAASRQDRNLDRLKARLRAKAGGRVTPVIGITGTGGGRQVLPDR